MFLFGDGLSIEQVQGGLVGGVLTAGVAGLAYLLTAKSKIKISESTAQTDNDMKELQTRRKEDRLDRREERMTLQTVNEELHKALFTANERIDTLENREGERDKKIELLVTAQQACLQRETEGARREERMEMKLTMTLDYLKRLTRDLIRRGVEFERIPDMTETTITAALTEAEASKETPR